MEQIRSGLAWQSKEFEKYQTGQVAKAMAKQDEAVGTWRAYLTVLSR